MWTAWPTASSSSGRILELDFRDLRADTYPGLSPFDWTSAYENERWRDEVRYYVNEPWFVQVLTGGCRVELDEDVDIEH